MDERRSQKPYDIERGVEVWTHTAAPLLIFHGEFLAVDDSAARAILGGRSKSGGLRFFLLCNRSPFCVQI